MTRRGRAALVIVVLLVGTIVGAGILLVLMVERPPGATMRQEEESPDLALPEWDPQGLSPALVSRLEERLDVVRAAPDSAEAWGRLAIAFDAHDMLPAAIRCYDEAEQLDPDDERWPFYRGICRLVGDQVAAIEDFRAAELIAPEHVPILLNLGRAYLESGRLDEAAIRIRRAEALAPSVPAVAVAAGLIALERGDDRIALERLRRAIALGATSGEADRAIAAVLQRQGDAAAAEAARARAEGRSLLEPIVDEERLALRLEAGATIAWRRLRARRLEAKGDATGAILEWREAVALEPDSIEAQIELAETLARANRTDDAITVLRELADHPDAPPTVLGNLGALLMARGDSEMALGLLRQAAAAMPDRPEATLNLAAALEREGRFADAADVLRPAIERFPGNDDLLLRRTALLSSAGDVATARAELLARLEADPTAARIRFEYANLLTTQREWDAAVAAYRRVLADAPEQVSAWRTLSRCLDAAGRGDEAVAVLEEGLALHPDEPQLIFTLSWLLATHADAAVRDGARAHALATRLVRRLPDSPEALDALAAACAEIGLFPEAVTQATRALALREELGASSLEIESAGTRLMLYRRGTPLRARSADTD